MAAQTQKQLAFMCRAFGGPQEYQGRDLATAHAHLVTERGLGDEHFDTIVRLLQETLVELDVPTPLQDKILSALGPLRSEVLRGAH